MTKQPKVMTALEMAAERVRAPYPVQCVCVVPSGTKMLL